MAEPTAPLDVPPEALTALESFRAAWAGQLPTEVQFGVGFKQSAGDYLDQIALIVFVPEKVPPGQVPPNQLIPSTWDDGGVTYPTDVIQSNPTDIAVLNDNAFYSILLGGIEIGWPQSVGPGVVNVHKGTLGCVAQRRSDGARQYLTAAHVVPAATGLDMNQPAPDAAQSAAIGTVAAFGSPWDCAVIDPNGTRGELLGVQDVGTVAGSASFQLWSVAKKRGRTTGLTSGVVVAFIPDPNGVGFERFRVSTFPVGGLFCWFGDSGSVVLDANGAVIGLLVQMDDYATDSSGDPATSIGVVIPIGRVLDALQVEIATPPTVNSVNPNTAQAVLASGGQTQIDGSGFDAGSTVSFDAAPALTVTPASPTRLLATPPVQPPGTSCDVIVTTSHGESSVAGPQTQFTY